MNLKRIALILGIALIPAWYLYRTLSDHSLSRLTWNEVFQTEDERLRKEIADEKERAQKEIAKIRAESSEGKRRQQAANCVQFAKVVHADYDRYVQERNQWNSHLDSLSTSKTGLAIAQNEDYMRTFHELRSQFELDPDVEEKISYIEDTSRSCEKDSGVNFEGEGGTEYLNQLRDRLQGPMRKLNEARSTLEAFEHLATGELPKSLEEGAKRQYLKELTENLKTKRQRELRGY